MRKGIVIDLAGLEKRIDQTCCSLSIAPDVPTVAEAGVPNYTTTSWFGVFVPASSPDNVVAKLHAEFVTGGQYRKGCK